MNLTVTIADYYGYPVTLQPRKNILIVFAKKRMFTRLIADCTIERKLR